MRVPLVRWLDVGESENAHGRARLRAQEANK
jgi:hypothetical protein